MPPALYRDWYSSGIRSGKSKEICSTYSALFYLPKGARKRDIDGRKAENQFALIRKHQWLHCLTSAPMEQFCDPHATDRERRVAVGGTGRHRVWDNELTRSAHSCRSGDRLARARSPQNGRWRFLLC